jgi:hypothetical protein
MAQGEFASQASATAQSSRSPFQLDAPPTRGTVSLRRMKESVRRLDPDHPLRLVLASEPDEISWEEYATKVEVWFRLLNVRAD